MSSGPGDRSGLTLHVTRSDADLARLGRTMANCLASYGRGRTSGQNRILEIRRDGRTVYAVHVRDRRIVMFEGPGNRPPHPADVPLVRDLLGHAGYLDVTAPAPPPLAPPPAVAPARPRAPARRRTPARRRRPAPTPAPAPPPPPGVSVQALATDLLRPPVLGRTEWPELAAALWARGVLPVLPDPSETVYERVVRDLAGRLAVGADDGLPRHPAPGPRERADARRQLLAGPPPDTSEAWQRHRMAEVLAVEIRP